MILPKKKPEFLLYLALTQVFNHNYDLTGVDPDHLSLHACARMTLEYGVKTHSRRKQFFWHRFLYINYLLKAQMFNAGPNPWRGIDEEACSVNLLSHLTWFSVVRRTRSSTTVWQTVPGIRILHWNIWSSLLQRVRTHTHTHTHAAHTFCDTNLPYYWCRFAAV